LVVLSGCQTSGYQFFGTLPGPAESFFIAGASGVIVSLWNVEDRSTYLLMTRFYRDLASASGANGSSRGAAWALRDAKQWVRDYVDRDGRTPFRNPAYWAGFVLIGGDPLVGRRVAPAQ
jgi:CHAT domain-containing protein